MRVLVSVVKGLPAAALLLLLSACAVLPGGRDNTQPRSADFDLLGRVQVAGGGKAFTSNMRWLHVPERDELWLLTPTGQALAHIVDSPRGATLTAADQTAYHSASVESLTRQALGWELPLARLQHWVRGAPIPGVAVEAPERDTDGRLVKFAQDGWQVSYVYAERTEPPEAQGQPRRLEIANGENRIRLVIDRWRRESDPQ